MDYYAVCNLDNMTVITVEPSERSATDTMHELAHPAQPHLVSPIRNMMIAPVESSIFVAYSEGRALEFDIDEVDGRLAPVVRIAQRRKKDSVAQLIRDSLAGYIG